MGLSLRGQTSGAIDINAPNAAGNNTITLPGSNGAANQFYKNSATAGTLTHSTMVELSTGFVGINDNSPDTRLSVNSGATDVVAKFTSSDSNAWIQLRDNTTTDTGVMVGANGDNLLLRAGSNERVRITSTGTLDFRSVDGVGINFLESGYINIDSDNNDSNRNFTFFDAKDTGSQKYLMILTDSGNIGINTNTPDKKLTVFTDSNTGYSTETNNTPGTNSLIKLFNKNGSDGTGVNNYAAIEFAVANGATSSGYLGYTRTGDNAGAFFMKQRNTSTAYPETIRFPSSGGITFGGGANAANTIDDYEKGTYTITSSGILNQGTLQTDDYIKIGDQVTYLINLYASGNNMSWSTGATISFGGFAPIANFHTTASLAWYKSDGTTDFQPNYFNSIGEIILRSAQTSVRHLWGFVTFVAQ